MPILGRRIRLLMPFVRRNIREQYAGSWGGVIWSIFQPLFLILLYWWVFSEIFKIRAPVSDGTESRPFLVFLLSALLPWFAFQDGLIKGSAAIVAHRDVVKKVHFPVIIFPLAAVVAAAISQGIGFCLFLSVLFCWEGHVTVSQMVALTMLLGLQVLATSGLALLLSALMVYLRDISQILALILPAIFYTAPILYPLNLVPKKFHILVFINPFAAFAEGYHSILLDSAWPSFFTISVLVVLTVGALGSGIYVFRRLQTGFADVL
ncbi:MAG: ABC transporter permease [Gammaproteobacteria bacterium]|nr:ABC transporter permease [Gammaproteobacteria bacterium]MCP5423722.1 ABC transporter permease [Gammaproteobacteria bacterium]MCP5459696.1 ABC transporter permease [Gammaproteobacteria bacterium]